MRLFVMYRRGDISATHDASQANPPEAPQFEGVEFDDGTVAIRWLTPYRSVSVWNSLEDMLAVHGHPEYGSELAFVSTKNGVSAGRTEDGNSRLDDRDRLLSASRAESDPLPADPLEPIGALARASINRPLRYCPTCRDTHAEDAPHFANRVRENAV